MAVNLVAGAGVRSSGKAGDRTGRSVTTRLSLLGSEKAGLNHCAITETDSCLHTHYLHVLDTNPHGGGGNERLQNDLAGDRNGIVARSCPVSFAARLHVFQFVILQSAAFSIVSIIHNNDFNY